GLIGGHQNKMTKAVAGDVVAFGKLDAVGTGEMLGATGTKKGDWPGSLPPLFSLAVHTDKKQDEVKLSGALAKLVEEDPSLSLDHNADTGQLIMWGQGEIHLQVALEKLHSRYNLSVSGQRPQVPYKETIRKAVSQHGRHKRQSGGHGQFG